MTVTPARLDIWWVDLEPTRGSETQKKRPCVIVQSDLVNPRSQTFLIAPLLPDHKNWPFAVNVSPTKANGIDKARHINVKQICAVDISRFSKLQGRLEKRYSDGLEEALRIVFGL